MLDGAGCSSSDLGVPTLRLKGPYFALAMLSAAVIMQRLMLIFWEQHRRRGRPQRHPSR